MKRLYISVGAVWMALQLCPSVHGQSDASIKAAKSTAAAAGLKKYQKFSGNDGKPWLYGGDVTLSFASTSLSNWSGGGEDQISIAPAVNLYANYKKGKRTWENYGIFNYSIQKNGERKAVKNSDNINLITKIGQQITPKWFYTASFLVCTQFSPGFKYSATDTVRVSDFLAPVSLFLSIGVDYRPNNNISVVMSPLMGKATYARSDDMLVLSNAGLVTTEKDSSGADVKIPHKSRYELGGGLVASWKGNTLKNKLSCDTQVELFSNYAKQPENIDVTWRVIAKYLIYKNISFDLRFDLLFDDDKKTTDENGQLRGAKIQMKNYVGASLFYQF
ncbi:MAG: DUF3078 domain-containing protein [Bacteroidales bacterium]|jgi:hypothetical protein|nr:DUF3078 domain-containing protein [Bacteroidales bacterium]